LIDKGFVMKIVARRATMKAFDPYGNVIFKVQRSRGCRGCRSLCMCPCTKKKCGQVCLTKWRVRGSNNKTIGFVTQPLLNCFWSKMDLIDNTSYTAKPFMIMQAAPGSTEIIEPGARLCCCGRARRYGCGRPKPCCSAPTWAGPAAVKACCCIYYTCGKAPGSIVKIRPKKCGCCKCLCDCCGCQNARRKCCRDWKTCCQTRLDHCCGLITCCWGGCVKTCAFGQGVSDDVAKYNKFIDKTLKKRKECCCCPLITCCKNYFCSRSNEQLITMPKVVGRLGSKKHPQQPISRRQKAILLAAFFANQ